MNFSAGSSFHFTLFAVTVYSTWNNKGIFQPIMDDGGCLFCENSLRQICHVSLSLKGAWTSLLIADKRLRRNPIQIYLSLIYLEVLWFIHTALCDEALKLVSGSRSHSGVVRPVLWNGACLIHITSHYWILSVRRLVVWKYMLMISCKVWISKRLTKIYLLICKCQAKN